MGVHDLVFFIGTIILIWGPLKMVASHYTPPISATLLTALPLTAFALNYGTMDYWWSAVAQVIQVCLWFILVYRGYLQYRLRQLPINKLQVIIDDRAN
jgi:hypothetical protein